MDRNYLDYPYKETLFLFCFLDPRPGARRIAIEICNFKIYLIYLINLYKDLRQILSIRAMRCMAFIILN